jgi:S-methylmethionine-dependent homocysteine/selenocysteine methylase
MVGEYFSVDPRNIHGYVIGEHGDSEFVPWSQALLSTKRVTDICSENNSYSIEDLEKISEQVRTSAYTIIKAKNATYYGIGMSLVRLTKAIMGNENSVLTVSAKLTGEYGMKGVYVGIPCIIGRNGVSRELEIDLTEDELRDSYRRLIVALDKSGVDIFLIESITDVRNAEIAAEVCREVAPETPIIFSATLSKIGGLLSSGRSVEKYVEDITKFNPLAIGFNCSHGVKNIVDNIELLTRYTSLPTYVAPSAGLPDGKGKYPETVKKHTETLRTAAEKGILSIVGGCCGTTAEYTRSIAQMARHYKPRK